MYYSLMNVPPVLSPPLLAAENVSVTLGGTKILDGVSLSLRSGEIVTLIGPNGSGKTTLVRILLGLIRPDSGRVVRGAERIGYVPQFFVRDRTKHRSTQHGAPEKLIHDWTRGGDDARPHPRAHGCGRGDGCRARPAWRRRSRTAG